MNKLPDPPPWTKHQVDGLLEMLLREHFEKAREAIHGVKDDSVRRTGVVCHSP